MERHHPETNLMASSRESGTPGQRGISHHIMRAEASYLRHQQAQAARMSSSDIITDQDGDLHLEVGANHYDKPVSFLVRSKNLAMASPVFKSMLFGPFAESNKNMTGDWVVRLPDEHPHGFGIVMDIIHLNSNKIPVYLEEHPYKSKFSDRLYEIARTVDKYDMADVVLPWVDTWLEEASVYHTCSSEPRYHGRLIWIAWVFGDEKLVSAELDAVVLDVYIHDTDDETSNDSQQNSNQKGHERQGEGDSEDYRIIDRENRCTSLYSPEGEDNAILALLDVADAIKDTRLQIITSLLDPVASLLQQPLVYTKATHGHVNVDYSVVYTSHRYGEQAFWLYNKPSVTPTTLGDLLRGHELFPLPEPEEYKGSVVQLYAQLKELRRIFAESIMRSDSHNDWSDWKDMYHVMQELDVVFNNRPSVPLSKVERERLQRHRQKCGQAER